MASSERIDVHAHFIPPFYRGELLATGHGQPDGMPRLPVTTPLDLPTLIDDLC